MPDYIIFVDKGDDQYVKLTTSGASQEKVADAYYDLPDSSDTDQIEVTSKANIKRFGVTRSVGVIGETPKRRRRKAPTEQPVEDGPEPGTEAAAEALSDDAPEEPNVEVGAGAPDEPEQEHVEDPNGNTEDAEAKSPFKTRSKS